MPQQILHSHLSKFQFENSMLIVAKFQGHSEDNESLPLVKYLLNHLQNKYLHEQQFPFDVPVPHETLHMRAI